MIPHIHTLFEFISTPYENQHQTLNMKISGFESIQLRYCNLMSTQPPTNRKSRVIETTHTEKYVIYPPYRD